MFIKLECTTLDKIDIVFYIVVTLSNNFIPAPISVPHETSKDIEVGGYTIPANTMVVSNLYAATMDENLFPNPRKFNPERFLDANGKLTKTDTIMPFSVGMLFELISIYISY